MYLQNKRELAKNSSKFNSKVYIKKVITGLQLVSNQDDVIDALDIFGFA